VTAPLPTVRLRRPLFDLEAAGGERRAITLTDPDGGTYLTIGYPKRHLVWPTGVHEFEIDRGKLGRYMQEMTGLSENELRTLHPLDLQQIETLVLAYFEETLGEVAAIDSPLPVAPAD